MRSEDLERIGFNLKRMEQIEFPDAMYGMMRPLWKHCIHAVQFAKLGDESGGAAAATELAVGISEALYNTALGIGTSAIALFFYNVFTTRIDGITFGIDESGFTLTQSFAAQYK